MGDLPVAWQLPSPINLQIHELFHVLRGNTFG